MAATARRLVASSILYLDRLKRVQFQVTLPIPLHQSASRRHFSVASPEQSGPFQSGDGSGPCSDKFHKWHNGGGTLHELSSIDSSAVVEIGAVVHSKAIVGENVRIGSGTIVGPSVIIGRSTKMGYDVAMSNCQVGELCVVHNGVCIGQDGFGFYVDGNGNMIKNPQENPTLRPTIASIMVMLSSYSVTLPDPQEPAFLVGHHRTDSNNPAIRIKKSSHQSTRKFVHIGL